MKIELTKRYPLLAELVELDRKYPADDSMLASVINNITIDNVSYRVHKAMMKSSVDYYAQNSEVWLSSGTGFRASAHQDELDQLTVANLAEWMALKVSDKGLVKCLYALLRDEASLNSGRVKEVVSSQSGQVLPDENWVDMDRVIEMEKNSERVILLSPGAAIYLLDPGQFAHYDSPSTMRSRLAKLLDYFQSDPLRRHRIFVIESLYGVQVTE